MRLPAASDYCAKVTRSAADSSLITTKRPSWRLSRNQSHGTKPRYQGGGSMTTPSYRSQAQFLSSAQAAEIKERFGTPCYVYDRSLLEATARHALTFSAPYGFTLRYAMKANPSLGVLQVFRDLGVHIDASSDFEVERALRAGFTPDQIQLTSQMP